MRDMHNNIKVVNAITPQAVGTTGAANGKTSAAIDRQGYETVEFVYQGSGGASGDTITPVVKECDTASGTFTSVAAIDLLGTEAAITLTTAAAQKVGYIGNKRYLKFQLYGLGTATAVVAAAAILGKPSRAPVS